MSETCRCPWSEVYEMGVIEFLNVLAYARDKAAKQKEDIDKWRKRH